MINNIEKEGNIFFAEVSDMITKEDIESIIPIVEEMISEHKKIKCLIIITELKGYTIGGFLADFGFYFKHKEAFEYMAIVGDKAYEKSIIEFFDYFLPGKAKYFDVLQLDKAKEWIKQV